MQPNGVDFDSYLLVSKYAMQGSISLYFSIRLFLVKKHKLFKIYCYEKHDNRLKPKRISRHKPLEDKQWFTINSHEEQVEYLFLFVP